MTQLGEGVAIIIDEPEIEEEKEEEKKSVKIRFCIFFDGTCNNRTNTDQRATASNMKLSDDARKKASAIYEKHKGDGSYENDHTNVAKMEKYIDNAKGYKLTLSTYIEGPGTENKEGDDMLGYALGWFDKGIRAKVKKGVLDVVSMISRQVKKDTIIECLTLDVFGFSRGAAGARNFIYEALKGDKNTPIKVQLADKGYDAKKVEVCFAGLYDTVSAYGLVHWNDVSDLKLKAVRHAKKVVQLAAADEHRENFSLTSIQSAGFKGREIFLPGVHSDIGGSYKDNMTENQVIFDGMESAADDDRSQLIKSGWYRKHEIELKPYAVDAYSSYAILTVNRPGISNRYSRIPLHIMARFARENDINIEDKLNDDEEIPRALNRVKQRIEKYIADTDPKRFSARKSSMEDWRHNEVWLRDLRHDYFHFSAKWSFGLKPRLSWWQGKRYRKVYNG